MAIRNLPSKEPVNDAAGPYGHPLHPLFVTIPIGTWVASLVFDIASTMAEDPAVYEIGARWLIGIGIVGAVVAAIFGLMDLMTTPAGTPARRTGLTHMTLNLLVTAAFIVSWFMRDGVETEDGSTSTAMIVLSVVALLVLTVSGFLGGKLAYRYGVRVAREEDQADGYERTTTTSQVGGTTV